MTLPASNSNCVDLIKRVHRDNFTLRHFAEDREANIRSTMLLTPIVYPFLIYNSSYQVDWPASIRSGALKYHPHGDEEGSQAAFEEFMHIAPHSIPDALNRAFADIEAINMTGSRTRIVPDAVITEERGIKFFNDLRAFQQVLCMLRRSHDPASLRESISYIRELRPFIYRVRCSTFHGRKSLAEAVETNQNRRIKLYYLFLNGIVTLFFLLVVETYAPSNNSLHRTPPAGENS